MIKVFAPQRVKGKSCCLLAFCNRAKLATVQYSSCSSRSSVRNPSSLIVCSKKINSPRCADRACVPFLRLPWSEYRPAAATTTKATTTRRTRNPETTVVMSIISIQPEVLLLGE